MGGGVPGLYSMAVCILFHIMDAINFIPMASGKKTIWNVFCISIWNKIVGHIDRIIKHSPVN